MPYLFMWTPTPNGVSSKPPTPELMADLGAYFHDVGAATVIAGGLRPLAEGARVAVDAGEVVVTDGPFTEAKEVIAGFSIVDVDSKEEAVQWAQRFVQIHVNHGWEGTCEVRPMHVSPPGG